MFFHWNSFDRAVCGVRGKTLIINLPGSPKAVSECLSTIASVIPHAVDLLTNNRVSVTATHNCVQHHTSHHSHHHYLPNQMFGEPILSLDDIAGRLRESPFPMISIEESQKILESTIEKNSASVKVDIWESFGRVLAETVYSPCDLPPFRASIKDGYAVIAKDGKGERTVLGTSEAGHEVSTHDSSVTKFLQIFWSSLPQALYQK